MINKQIKILLVEDNPNDVCLIREMLAGYTVTRFDVVHAELLKKAIE